MIAARSFEHADVGVFGLARSGMSSVRALKAGGSRVYAWDDREETRKAAAAEGATVAPWARWPWDKLKALVLSPGVPLTHPAPHEIVLAVVGGLFVFETISVIVQVISFKTTGKRVFRMAPIHHHYEQLGWKEPTIVIRFWIVAVVLALVGLSTLKLR
jgi:hypothetical protein